MDSLDVHIGQSYSVLVTADQEVQDYYIVAAPKMVNATRFSSLIGVAELHYDGSTVPARGSLPPGPDPFDIQFSINQAKSISLQELVLFVDHMVSDLRRKHHQIPTDEHKWLCVSVFIETNSPPEFLHFLPVRGGDITVSSSFRLFWEATLSALPPKSASKSGCSTHGPCGARAPAGGAGGVSCLFSAYPPMVASRAVYCLSPRGVTETWGSTREAPRYWKLLSMVFTSGKQELL